ncbi:hypothetical protein [Nostoc cycadae]|uniref:Alpha-L-fucosidase n=1 Tax=Nostoc cycadae WK-1 TaxID=1861711 RepID=A0A2H6LCR8_9NOSO|nr:hypothetical protein [Nostoc cycadae]GBE91019.1 alpha-L-fucosidase [Nostoc cycadae WK-1]
MIISDLEILEVVEVANVQGGIVTRGYLQNDFVNVNFSSFNRFQTVVVDPRTAGNSAAAGAKGDAQNNRRNLFGFTDPTYSYTKADTIAVADYLGESFSGSTSVSVINRA